MKTLLGVLALWVAAASAAQAQDVIHFKDGTADVDCEVVSLSYRTVDYDIVLGNKVRQQADAKKVADISVDKNQSTFEFNQGQSAMEAGNFAEAIRAFQRVTGDQRARDLLKQTAAINMVRCQYYSENVPGCLAAIQGLRALKPDSFYLMESFQMEIKACLAKNDVAGAQAAVTALEGKGNSENMPEWARAADVLRGGLMELQKKWREALTIYRKYQTDKDAGDDAKMGELRCLKETADWAGLSVRSEQILGELHNRKTPNDRLSTAAYNARGEASLNAGKIKEALLDFMQGVAVFSKGGGGNREHETALARASFACTRIALAEKADKVRRDLYKRRAMELEADLKRGYPGSNYGPDLKRAIDEVK